MPTLQKNLFTHIKEWLLVTVGILIYVMSWSVFLIPNNLIGGGVSGISSMIQYATGGVIQMGYSYFVLNAILVAAAVVILGMGFGAKTIYAIVLASIALRFLPGMVPATIIKTLAIDNGKLLSVLMGGLLAGIGIGMSISNGGSTGGTDIIALIYTKYHNVSPGKVFPRFQAEQFVLARRSAPPLRELDLPGGRKSRDLQDALCREDNHGIVRSYPGYGEQLRAGYVHLRFPAECAAFHPVQGV